MNRNFTKDNMQMAKKHLKNYSISLVNMNAFNFYGMNILCVKNELIFVLYSFKIEVVISLQNDYT